MDELKKQLDKLKGHVALINSLANKKEIAAALEEIELLKATTDDTYVALRRAQFKTLTLKKYGNIVENSGCAQ